jgi:hypothetical protein
MKLLFSGANTSANGISSPLYAGQQKAVIYGLQVQARGYFDVYQFKVELSGSPTSILDQNSVKINKSLDSFFGNADDEVIADISNGNFWDGAIQYYGNSNNPFARFWSTGDANGGIGAAGYLFITANVKSDANINNSFAFTGAPLLTGASSEQNYASSNGTVISPGTTASGSGNVYDWASTGSTDWSLSSNWRLGNGSTPSLAPGINDLVRIGVNRDYTISPVLSSNTKIGNLMVGTGKAGNTSITISAAATLTIAGTFTNSRTLNVLGSGSLAVEGNWLSSDGKINLLDGNVTVKFTGSKGQLLQDSGSDGGKGVTFGNVVFSGGGTKTLGGTGKFSVAVGKFLKMSEGTTLEAAGLLTLKASASGAAALDIIPNTAAIKGDVTVERFIAGGNKNMWRTNRMLSSPIYDNTTSFTNANVDGGRKYSFKQFIDDMLITGEGGAANGFDVNANNEASAWTYAGGFVALKTINTSVNVGKGAFIYFRGDRSNPTGKLNAPYVDAESVVMTFKGTLNQQDVTVPFTGTQLLGNPYVATIDWSKVTKSGNVGQVIKVWNPKNRQYSVYNGQHGINDGGPFIGPGQAFFVQTTNTSQAEVKFTESSKVSNNINPATPLYSTLMFVQEKATDSKVMVANTNENLEKTSTIRVLLTRDNTENSDETLVVLKRNEVATVAGSDVVRSGGEEIFLSSLSSEGRKMAINYMPHLSSLSGLKLGVEVNNSGTYKMSFSLADIPTGYEVKLKDNYAKTITDIDFDGVPYAFSVDKSIGNSFGLARFELLFTPITTLPVVFKDFTGDKTNQGILLRWKTSSEESNSHFEIRRAGEEKIFTTIGTVVPNSSGAYQLLDASPLSGNNYYKLYQIDNDGKSAAHNKVVVVKHQLNENIASQLSVYPTVVETSYTVKFTGDLTTDRFVMKLTDITGKEVSNKVLSKAEIFNGYSSDFPATSAGIYFATLVDLANGSQLGVVKIMKK